MEDFKVTSKFVGVSLNSILFLNLFTQLRDYLIQNNLLRDIILHDINNLHLTLYYLDAYFPEEENRKLRLFTDKLKKEFKSFKLSIIAFNYFYNDKENNLAYFETDNTERLTEVNHELRLNFPNQVLDNTYNFIAHVTLFRIKNVPLFKAHKGNLEEILNIFIKEAKDENFFKDINIFYVDSTKEPENYIIA